jgi:hypothetical protein
MRFLLAFCLAAASLAGYASAPLDEALARARAEQRPVLLDFTAPWCYSCYFMKKNVLTGAEWAKTERETVVLTVDADSPDGAALKDRFAVKALPSYVVLNPYGAELGRIHAERTRAQFYTELKGILAANTALDAQRAIAAGETRDGSQRARAALVVLQTHLARNEAQTGLDWFTSLSSDKQEAARKNDAVIRTLARLRLKAAATTKQPQACLSAAREALIGQLDCESFYDLDTVLECTATTPAEARKAFLTAEAPRFEKLLTGSVLTKTQGCADARSALFATADLHEALGDTQARQATFAQGIRYFERKTAKGVKADRNAADNLRVLYDAAGEPAKLDALLVKLIAAYPDDYVYASRYARLLAGRGEHTKALPYFAQAAEKAYGINRLKNAQARVASLLALQRTDEARAVTAEALKANGPFFPEEMTKLKALLPAA